MTERMHVQIVWQIVFLEDKFEAPCECCRCHWLVQLMLSEQKIVVGYSPPLIVQCLSLAVAAVLFQQSSHLRREVHISVARLCFRLFDAEILAADLNHVSADMYAAPGVVNVAPLYAAALAAPYPGRDDELEVSLVLDAFFLQRADQLMTRTSAS